MRNSPQRNEKLAGKRAIVTGGSRGIGAAIAQAFVIEGAIIAIIHRDDRDNAERTLGGLMAVNKNCLALDCDIADPHKVRTSIDAVQDRFGGVDILVNCAAIGVTGRFEDATLDDWNRVLSVNLTGAFLMSRYCYPIMRGNQWGRIINISSQLAFSGGGEAAAYCASKAGLIGLTRSLAVEAAPFGVLVNCIAPGATMTDTLRNCGEEYLAKLLPKIPLGRFGKPEEIAATAVLLASEEGAYYVGQTLSPNGGDVLR
jgi:3-oxoacyl-[acyl-carrier protein] reductase